MRGDVFLDQQSESAVRQSGAATQDVSQFFQSTRTAASTVEGAFTPGTRADRLAAVGMQSGDRFLETDTLLEYYYTGLGWAFLGGVYVATDAQRAALASLSTADNGALSLTTDTLAFWQVSAGAWLKRLEVIGTANQITATIAAGVLTLSLNASPDVTTAYKVGGNQIVGARKTGWTLPTSTQTRTNADYAALSLAQLAEVVAALVNDLHASGGTQHKLLST